MSPAHARPHVVLVHGWSADSRVWSPVMAAFRDEAVFSAPDLPGHGDSPLHMDGQSLDGYHAFAVDQLCAWCEHEGLATAPIAAWAWGTWVVLDAVASGRLKPRSLLLVATAPTSQSPDPYTGPLSRDWPRYIQSLVRMMCAAPISPEAERWLTKIMRNTSMAAAAGVHLAEWRPPDTTFRLPSHSRLVLGDLDPIHPGDAGEQMAEAWGVASVHHIAEAGHTPFLESRKDFGLVFRGWLEDMRGDT